MEAAFKQLQKQAYPSFTLKYLSVQTVLTLKRLGGGQFDNASSKESLKLVFLTYNIIINHIFPENFIEITEVVQKI